MIVREFVWSPDRADHIAKHGIDPIEVEETCFGRALTFRARSEGPNPVYYVLGRTMSGRPLFCVIIQFPDDRGYPAARPMTDSERNRYRRWSKR